MAGATVDAFSRNWGMQRAVERALEMISEASRHFVQEHLSPLAIAIEQLIAEVERREQG